MNTLLIVANHALVLALLGLIFAVCYRHVLQKYWSSNKSSENVEEMSLVPMQASFDNVIDYPAADQTSWYTKPTFKNNNLEDDIISRSFRIENTTIFDDDGMDMILHAAGLSNNLFIED